LPMLIGLSWFWWNVVSTLYFRKRFVHRQDQLYLKVEFPLEIGRGLVGSNLCTALEYYDIPMRCCVISGVVSFGLVVLLSLFYALYAAFPLVIIMLFVFTWILPFFGWLLLQTSFRYRKKLSAIEYCKEEFILVSIIFMIALLYCILGLLIGLKVDGYIGSNWYLVFFPVWLIFPVVVGGNIGYRLFKQSPSYPLFSKQQLYLWGVFAGLTLWFIVYSLRLEEVFVIYHSYLHIPFYIIEVALCITFMVNGIKQLKKEHREYLIYYTAIDKARDLKSKELAQLGPGIVIQT